jgi:hypothetical protein
MSHLLFPLHLRFCTLCFHKRDYHQIIQPALITSDIGISGLPEVLHLFIIQMRPSATIQGGSRQFYIEVMEGYAKF